jgi:hypothetical protein
LPCTREQRHLVAGGFFAAELRAHVAAAAVRRRIFRAEVAQDGGVAAGAALRPAQELEEHVPFVFHERRIRRSTIAVGLQQPSAQGDVLRRAQEQPVRELPVAPRAADLLVIRLDRARRRQVDDRAHVGAVDPHAEGVGSDHDLQLAVREGRLHAFALASGQARMVGIGEPTVVPQPLRFSLAALPGRPVDDGRGDGRGCRGRRAPTRLSAWAPERFAQLGVRVLAGFAGALHLARAEHQVGALKAVDDLRRIRRQPQPAQDLVTHDRRGGGGAGEHPGLGQSRQHAVDLHVFGAEVMPPFADAVSLVDGHERTVDFGQERLEPGKREPLGRDVDELVGAAREAGDAPPELLRRERRCEKGGGDAAPLERHHLIVHERDERRDHDGGAAEQARWQLIDEALAAARRRDEEQPSLAQERLDRAPLPAAEAVVAEPPQRGLEGFRHERSAPRGRRRWGRGQLRGPFCGRLRGRAGGQKRGRGLRFWARDGHSGLAGQARVALGSRATLL